ncbi:MAG: acylneuraminate cytidylyltransferase family protein [Rhodospirillaceae bacterium]|nr:acylneuraminate cytidylyltransferase family protein [Rhodospirillaceae bacterium]
MKRLAIIPARGGSKRLPDKNIKDFCGKPMIGHILHQAKASKLFDTIHVSTEDDKVKKTVEDLGFVIDFPRPDNLSDDYTPLIDVLRFVVGHYKQRGQSFDQVWLLMACTPLIDAKMLCDASSVFESGGGKNPVLGVAEFPVPIDWAYLIDNKGLLSPCVPGAGMKRSQDMPTHYYDAGALVIYHPDEIASGKDASDFLPYIIPRQYAVDIDTEEDWKFAEILYRGISK